MWRVLEVIHSTLKKVSSVIQTVVNSILLTLVYFISIGSTSLIAKKVFKKSFLNMKMKHSGSYWIEEPSTTQPKESYYRQF